MNRRSFLRAGAAGIAASSLPRFSIAQPAKARVLRFVPQANLTVLDPIITTAAVTLNHGWMVWDTLFGVDAAQQAKPQMAEGYTVSDDGRTYLIKLRQGLKWHDGEPVRAQDCSASLARWAVRDMRPPRPPRCRAARWTGTSRCRPISYRCCGATRHRHRAIQSAGLYRRAAVQSSASAVQTTCACAARC